MLLALSIAMPQNALVIGWVAAVPDWIGLLPTGLAVRAVAAADATSAALFAAAMIGQIVALVAVGYVLLERQLRHGVVAAGGREAVARLPRGTPRMRDAVVGGGRCLRRCNGASSSFSAAIAPSRSRRFCSLSS
jgi:hypothetical protein